ncbi:MAG: response regulator transcription factor [Sphingomonadales bacterium]|nr:response regulator transcription factor [Sphingomonadales bacterium]
MTPYKILVAEDTPDAREIIEYNLKKEGFEVYVTQNGQEALKKLREVTPDVIILDVMMPVLDGIETCRQIRKMEGYKDVLIAFLTAREEEFVEVMGFDAGADDYIPKPIKPSALVSRVNALIRRAALTRNVSPTRLEMPPLFIDRETYSVTLNGNVVPLARKEFELLYLLAFSPGKVFNRDKILELIWGNDVVVINRTIDVHVRKLREKLGDDYIVTIKGVGYKFVSP